MVQFLNENAGALTVVFTAVVAISTVVYAILTARLVSETRRMRMVQTEPRIEVTITHLDIAIHFIRLRIKNVGLGGAKNICFDFSVMSGGESAQKLLEDFTESNFFTTGLRYLGPNQELLSTYTQMTDDHDGKIASVLLANVTYEGITGEKYCDTIQIDMSEIKGMYQLGMPHDYAIAQSLEKIQKSIMNIETGFRRPKVDVFDNKDRDKERKKREAMFAELKENSTKTKNQKNDTDSVRNPTDEDQQ